MIRKLNRQRLSKIYIDSIFFVLILFLFSRFIPYFTAKDITNIQCVGCVQNQEKIASLQKQIKTVPPYIIQQLNKDGYCINIVNNDTYSLNNKQADITTEGCILYDENIILISDKDKTPQSTILHEIGHYTNTICGYPCRYPGFNVAYETEGMKYNQNTSTIINSPEEYFADLFSTYLLNPIETEQKYPLSTKYIKKVVNNIS